MSKQVRKKAWKGSARAGYNFVLAPSHDFSEAVLNRATAANTTSAQYLTLQKLYACLYINYCQELFDTWLLEFFFNARSYYLTCCLKIWSFWNPFPPLMAEIMGKEMILSHKAHPFHVHVANANSDKCLWLLRRWSSLSWKWNAGK